MTFLSKNKNKTKPKTLNKPEIQGYYMMSRNTCFTEISLLSLSGGNNNKNRRKILTANKISVFSSKHC